MRYDVCERKPDHDSSSQVAKISGITYLDLTSEFGDQGVDTQGR